MSNNVVMIVEDDASLREALGETLELAGYTAMLADNGKDALTQLNKTLPQVIVSDIQMDKMNGHQLLKSLRQQYPQIPVIFMTAHGDVTDAVTAMQNGVVDYLTKPFESELFLEKVKRYALTQISDNNEPVAEDKKSRALFAMAKRVAITDATVLISGESGTGKEVLARLVHDHSKRKDNGFIAVNCAAIPENMLEATLFGYEKGAFTGAYKATQGKFELAQEGTLLLDEISEMDLSLQAKILRVLQEKEVERIGSNKIIKLNVRVLATTNRDLKAEVKENRFREDLYYRLNVFPLHWCPLRERKDDILPMINYLLQLHAQLANRVCPKLTKSAETIALEYDWPGNAREMDNIVQRMLILQTSDSIDADDFHLETTHLIERDTNTLAVNDKPDLADNLQTAEFKLIVEALEKFEGNRSQVAKSLSVSQRTLRYKLAKMRDLGFKVELES